MNYKKKYDEALERARKIHGEIVNNELIGFPGQIEAIFPQLRESEDEKTRKWIVNLLHELHYNQTAQPMALKAIEYLEKQKENPKSADSIPADCVSDVKCEDRSPKHSDSFGTDIRDTPAYWRGWDDAMEQKEQKPVEWSEEDEEVMEDLYNFVISDFIQDHIHETRWKPWKTTLERNRQNRLKSLHPDSYKNCNSRRSEEDEDNLKAIIRIIEDNDSDWKELTDWLNSLHDNYKKCNSRWKPSEEQIYSLGTVVKGYNECTVGSVGYHLKELYEQLKKLK